MIKLLVVNIFDVYLDSFTVCKTVWWADVCLNFSFKGNIE